MQTSTTAATVPAVAAIVTFEGPLSNAVSVVVAMRAIEGDGDATRGPAKFDAEPYANDVEWNVLAGETDATAADIPDKVLVALPPAKDGSAGGGVSV